MKDKNQVVFAVTSDGKDIFSCMTRIAVASIRLTNPGLSVVVACDSETDIAMRAINDPLLHEVDAWLVMNTFPGENSFRNRFVKTTLRKNIQGPFLFLDSDILVRGDLSPVFGINDDIAGARNHSREIYQKQIWNKDLEVINNMGWQISDKVYVNGGVLFFNDTPKAYEFVDLWHQKWLESWKKHERYRDQPALNSALRDSNAKIFILEDRYNAQVETCAKVAWDAIIWHYYYSGKNTLETTYEILFNTIDVKDNPNSKVIQKMITRKHPWRRDFFIDDVMARKIHRQGYKSKFDKQWFQGHRLKAVIVKFSEVYHLIISQYIRKIPLRLKY